MPNLFPENAYVLLDGETEKRYADVNGVVTIRSTQALSGIVGGVNSTITRFNLSASTIDTSNDVEVEIPIRTFLISLDYGELTNALINITGEVEGHDVVNGTVNVANGNLIQVSIVADNCKTIEDELAETTEHTEHTYTLQFQFLRTFNILLEDNTVPTNAYIQVTGEVDPRFADENGVISFRTSDAISGVASSSDSDALTAAFNYGIITSDTTHNIILYTPYIFEDATVQSIMLANWDTNSDGIITRPEINAITDLNLKFRYNANIISFNELQDFNGLESLLSSEFTSCTSLTSITFPTGLTHIGSSAFSGCNRMTGNIVIPTGVTNIGLLTFYNCSSLTGLTLHNNITSIGNLAFSGCSKITSNLVLPTNLIYIGNLSFFNCTKMTGNLVIPASLTSITDGAFLGCTSLTGLTLHDDVTNIGIHTFSGCTNISSNLVLPLNLTYLGSSAFSGCNRMTGNIVIPTGVTIIGDSTFYRCASLTGLTLHNNITSIGILAFRDCNNISGNLVLPLNLTRIGILTFYNCAKMTGNIVIPTGIKSITDSVFSYCSSLTGLTLHNNITSIGNLAFQGCTSLTSILILATTPPTIQSSTFTDTNNCPIYIPAGTLAAYSAATNWSALVSRFVEL